MTAYKKNNKNNNFVRIDVMIDPRIVKELKSSYELKSKLHFSNATAQTLETTDTLLPF